MRRDDSSVLILVLNITSKDGSLLSISLLSLHESFTFIFTFSIMLCLFHDPMRINTCSV